MTKRIKYEMTQKDLKKLMASMQPVPYMVIGGIAPRSQQENANTAWAQLGEKMNFDPMTVQPTGQGDCFFSAVSLPKKLQAKPHLKMDGDKWCATGPNFIDLAVSPAGFGDTPKNAIADLIARTLEIAI